MKFFISLLLLVCCKSVAAQLRTDRDILSLFTSDQKFVKMALDSSICILCQNYVLADSAGNEYGRNKDPYFGRKYSIGVITDKGILAPAEIITPWESDKNYDKYRKTDTLKPRLSTLLYKRVNEQHFSSIQKPAIKKLEDSSTIAYEIPDSIQTVPSSFVQADSSGWLIVLSCPDTILGDSSQITLTAIKPKMVAEGSTGKSYIKNIPQKTGTLGGFYFSCRIALGRIEFGATGIIKKDERGWFVQTFQRNAVKKPETKDVLNSLEQHD